MEGSPTDSKDPCTKVYSDKEKVPGLGVTNYVL